MEPKQKIPVIVFIEGNAPTDAERELMAKHKTKCCLTLSVERTSVRPHRFAVAADDKRIPAGYTTEAEYLKAEKDNKPKTGTPFITPPVVNAGPRGLAAE
jgi:hypothetical protein